MRWSSRVGRNPMDAAMCPSLANVRQLLNTAERVAARSSASPEWRPAAAREIAPEGRHLADWDEDELPEPQATDLESRLRIHMVNPQHSKRRDLVAGVSLPRWPWSR